MIVVTEKRGIKESDEQRECSRDKESEQNGCDREIQHDGNAALEALCPEPDDYADYHEWV